MRRQRGGSRIWKIETGGENDKSLVHANRRETVLPSSRFLVTRKGARLKEMKKVEILAPGGSREAIYAGIYGGADAIYTGTSRFSARAFAEKEKRSTSQ